MDSLLAGSLASVISAVGVYFARRAERNSRPVSNGFTTYVLEKLDRIEDKIDTHKH